MTFRGALLCLCCISVVASEDGRSCSDSQDQLFNRLSADLQTAVSSGGRPPTNWTAQQSAALLVTMRSLTHTLHTHQLEDCGGAEPGDCPDAEVPANGGLACVTFDNTRFCKPLCNHGYDFSFMRRTLLFNHCNAQTSFKWNSQYVGGNKLAVCNEAAFPVSGTARAYFLKDQECLAVKSNVQLTEGILQVLIAEIKSRGLEGEPQSACLVCGE